MFPSFTTFAAAAQLGHPPPLCRRSNILVNRLVRASPQLADTITEPTLNRSVNEALPSGRGATKRTTAPTSPVTCAVLVDRDDKTAPRMWRRRSVATERRRMTAGQWSPHAVEDMAPLRFRLVECTPCRELGVST